MYEAGFTYRIEEYGVVTLEAPDEDMADVLVREYVVETFPDAMNIEIDYIKEAKI